MSKDEKVKHTFMVSHYDISVRSERDGSAGARFLATIQAADGETPRAADLELAALLVRRANLVPELLDALNKAIAYLANPQAFDEEELGRQWFALKAKATGQAEKVSA
jgi:hypothetical protein